MGQQTAMFPQHHEFVFVYGARKVKLNRTVPNKGAGDPSGATIRQRDGAISSAKSRPIRQFRSLGSVVRVPPAKGAHDGDHPAIFPPAFPQAYIDATTQPDEIVIDPFAGSGSTMVAAHVLQRRCFMVELSPRYCDVIRERWRRLEVGE